MHRLIMRSITYSAITRECIKARSPEFFYICEMYQRTAVRMVEPDVNYLFIVCYIHNSPLGGYTGDRYTFIRCK